MPRLGLHIPGVWFYAHLVKVRTMSRAALGFALFLAAAGGSLAVSAAWGQGEPEYWIDGARPSRTEGGLYKEGEGCVPYSQARPDVNICGEVPDDYEPPPLPYHDAEICERAESQLTTWRARLSDAGATVAEIEQAHPEVDPTTCKVVELGPKDTSRAFRYLVSFAPSDPGKQDRVMVALEPETP